MIQTEKCIVMDLDGTLCMTKNPHEQYDSLEPIYEVVERVQEYKESGFYIILYTSRNMRTYDGNIGRINANTAKFTLDWLDRHEIPYDEIHFGKPWEGRGGFYVDDRAIRPKEFLHLDYEGITRLLSK